MPVFDTVGKPVLLCCHYYLFCCYKCLAADTNVMHIAKVPAGCLMSLPLLKLCNLKMLMQEWKKRVSVLTVIIHKLLSVKLICTCMFTLQACVPYFEMLEKWIYKGIIQDPYAEVRNN